MHRQRAAFLVGFLLIAALLGIVFAGCGSSSSSSGNTTEESTQAGSEESPTTAGKAPTGTPIKIGLITGTTGQFAATLGAVPDLAKVWEEAVNGSGGINGSPVKVIVKDDGSDPSKALKVVRELAGEEVVAIAGSWNTTGASWAPYAIEQEIPLVGGNITDPEIEAGPSFFPSGGNTPGMIYGVVKNAADAGVSQMGILYCAEIPTCLVLTNSAKVMAKEIGGIKVTSTEPISSTAPSLASPCLQAKQAGIDSMFVFDSGPVVGKAITECEHQGLEVPQFNFINSLSKEVFEEPVSEGMTVSFTNLPAADTSTPGGKYMNEMVSQYAPELPQSPSWNEAMPITWAGLQLFRKAAELGEVNGSSTSKEVLDGIYQIKNYDVEGLAPPVTFEKGKPTPANCWFTGEISEGKAVVPDNKSNCIPEDQVAAIYKSLAG